MHRPSPNLLTRDQVALYSLIAATGPAVAGFLIDTGVPALDGLACLVAGTALLVHAAAAWPTWSAVARAIRDVPAPAPVVVTPAAA